MFVDPKKLFQSQPTPPARPQPTNPLTPQATASGFQADGLSVSQLLTQAQAGPLQPLPADEGSYPEVLPDNLIRESFVTKMVFAL
ncbi:MAG TPA: hypothetical protein V6D23_08730, partial [Candidatus Obscuribacterales bacterium]